MNRDSSRTRLLTLPPSMRERQRKESVRFEMLRPNAYAADAFATKIGLERLENSCQMADAIRNLTLLCPSSSSVIFIESSVKVA